MYIEEMIDNLLAIKKNHGNIRVLHCTVHPVADDVEDMRVIDIKEGDSMTEHLVMEEGQKTEKAVLL